MAFPSRGAAAPAPAPTAPAPPAAQSAAPLPPAAPTAPAMQQNFWCAVNGASVLKSEAEARALPPSTQAMTEDQKSGWKTLGDLLGSASAAAAAPAGGRASFGQRAAPAAVAAPVAAGIPRGLFAGVENAEVTRKGNNCMPGDYIAKLCSAEFKQARAANYVILELECLISSYEENDPAKATCNREGSRFTVFVKQNDSFAGNIKEILLALSGFGPDGKARDEHDVVSQTEAESLVSPEQPFTGATVYLEARDIMTKQNKPFTRISWWPCPVLADGKPDTNKLFTEVR